MATESDAPYAALGPAQGGHLYNLYKLADNADNNSATSTLFWLVSAAPETPTSLVDRLVFDFDANADSEVLTETLPQYGQPTSLSVSCTQYPMAALLTRRDT